MAKILFVITEDWTLATHRLHLVKAAIRNGHKVAVATRINRLRAHFEAIGLTVFDWRLERRGLGVFKEIESVMALREIVMKFRPDLIHAVALKPVIYTGLATRFTFDGAVVSALGGVGYIFSADSIKARLLRTPVKMLLKLGLLGKSRLLILQNPDDIALWKRARAVVSDKFRLVRGAGVETALFTASSIPEGPSMIILPTRLLWDKGVGEFVNVARRLKAKRPKVRFVLVGDIDPHNPASITQDQINEWVTAGIVENLPRVGHEEMPAIYRQATIVCLPSYREGLPKALLEAASSARPVVAFDVSGCREIVRDGINGFLVPFRNELALEAALLELIDNKSRCAKFGKEGRKIVECEFSADVINRQTFEIWNELAEVKYEAID